MSNTIAYVDNQTLTNIADAVRYKTGTNGKMLLNEIPDKIRNIEGIIPSGSIEVTENGTYDVTTKASVIVNSPNQWTSDGIADNSQPSGDIVLTTAQLIGERAFIGRLGITSITSDSVLEIKTACFEGCTNLTSINLKNVTTTNGGFRNCSSLVEVHMPRITGITQSLFQNCTSIVQLYLPSAASVAIWGASGCTSLEELILPSCTSFGYYSWSQIEGDYALKDIVLGTNSIVRTEIKAFDKTNYAEGGEGGNIWIRKSLYDHLGDGSNLDILTNTAWNTLNSYGTITWRQIEGSKYETYMPNGQKYNEEMGITE